MKESRQKQFAALVIAGGLLLMAGCASNPTAADTEAFRSDVDKIFAVWIDTNINPDLEGFIAIWDENCIKMASNKPTVIGSATLREMKRKAFQMVIYEKVNVDIEEVQPAGSFGWAQGTYLVAVRPKAGGGTINSVGTFLTIFKKQPDGSWKVYRDTMMSAPALNAARKRSIR